MKRYEKSGVSIDSGNAFSEVIKDVCKSTYTDGVESGIGGFCSLYANPANSHSLIASSTDGVGHKILLASKFAEFGYLKTIGIDLVGMVMNDIVTCGATPLFLLDYYATPDLKQDADQGFKVSKQIIEGIAAGCSLSECALIGGETAEMPSVYETGKFDLCAFGVGVVDSNDVIRKERVLSGDVIIGIASSGPHSNGYTLINHAFKDFNWGQAPDVMHDLMRPTIIYTKLILDLTREFKAAIHGVAHITGGGLEENTKRVIPQDCFLEVDWSTWTRPLIFNLIKNQADMEECELREVYNCGIGMTLIVNEYTSSRILHAINKIGFKAWEIGKVRRV